MDDSDNHFGLKKVLILWSYGLLTSLSFLVNTHLLKIRE